MESRDNDLRDLRSSREQNRLSLRKRNIQDIIIKKRTGYNNINYTLDSKKIIVKPEYKDKRFNTLLDLLLFSSQIFQDQKSDINDIKFVIYLLKQSQIKNDIKNEVSDSNILKDIVIVLNKYINDVVVVDELISLLINFTFYLETETNMNLITNDYMKLYSSISSKYFNDNTIFNDLIILLGNLSNDNSSAQKIFYNTKLFDEIYNLSKNPKSPKNKKDVSIFFLGNFSIGISKNKDLVNNLTILEQMVDIMTDNIMEKDYSKICIVSLGEISEIRELVEYIVNKKNFFEFLYENKNPEFYCAINKILVNLTFVSEKINLFLIENYKNKIFPYIFSLLNSSSNLLKGQGLFLLGNIIENEPCKINEIINEAGFYDKIFEFLDLTLNEIIEKVIFLINVIVNSSDKVAIFKLYKKNIHLKLINILKNNYNKKIINETIDAIIDFLQKDTQDGIIRQSFIDNGIREIFGNLDFDRNDADLYLKVEEISKIFDKNYMHF
jgi:hypothetical protein